MKNQLFNKKIGLLVAFFILTATSLFAQQQLPVIKATSNVVDIRDGDNLRKGYWSILPDVKPDVYHVERYKGSKSVTFYTDIDSISFTVVPGNAYDFIILLNNKDSAFTRLSAVPSPTLTYTRSCTDCNGTTDTIPFTIGWNNSIKLKGRINKSDELDMIFDTGANGVVLSDDAYSKNTKVKIDGTIQGFGIGGSSQDDFSKFNKIEMAGLIWSGVPLTVKHVGKPNADVVIGYNVFDGKVVEIDYDRNVLLIHQSLPSKSKEYTGYNLNFRDGLSFIRLVFDDGKKKVEGLFDFDTGSAETIFLNNEFASENNLYGSMEKVGTDRLQGGGTNKINIDRLLLPKLFIGGHELKNVRIGIEDVAAKEGPPFNVVGNDILKRFNAIIDYQNDVVFLMPNGLMNDYYLYQRISFVIWAGVAFVLIIMGAIIVFYRRRKIKKSRFNIK